MGRYGDYRGGVVLALHTNTPHYGNSTHQQYMNTLHISSGVFRHTRRVHTQCITNTETHTNTITAGYIGKHPPQYKSCLREVAVWGLYFLEHCLTVYISVGVCLRVVYVCVLGAGMELWQCNHSLMTGCYLTPTFKWMQKIHTDEQLAYFSTPVCLFAP